jgi:hypothetical protein
VQKIIVSSKFGQFLLKKIVVYDFQSKYNIACIGVGVQRRAGVQGHWKGAGETIGIKEAHSNR